jgi:Terpene cyclase DEP1
VRAIIRPRPPLAAIFAEKSRTAGASGDNARMLMTRNALSAAYGVIAVLALVGTWGNNIHYLDRGFVAANVQFWTDTLANPASRSITVDIFFLGLAVFVWMVLEARRLGMRGVWLYLVFGILIAISVTVPIFLINRERALAARDRSSAAGTLGRGNAVALILLGLAFVAYTAVTLFRASP